MRVRRQDDSQKYELFFFHSVFTRAQVTPNFGFAFLLRDPIVDGKDPPPSFGVQFRDEQVRLETRVNTAVQAAVVLYVTRLSVGRNRVRGTGRARH